MDEAILASKYSTCLSTHYGDSLMDPLTGFIIATGHNGAPRGKEHCTDIGWCLKREIGYDHFQKSVSDWVGMEHCRCLHSEISSIGQAGQRAYGSVMFLYGERNGTPIVPQPCFSCVKLIINAGIKEVIIRPKTKFISIDPSKLYDSYVEELYAQMKDPEIKKVKGKKNVTQ
jgi:dCMP deaminase